MERGLEYLGEGGGVLGHHIELGRSKHPGGGLEYLGEVGWSTWERGLEYLGEGLVYLEERVRVPGTSEE